MVQTIIPSIMIEPASGKGVDAYAFNNRPESHSNCPIQDGSFFFAAL
jgi:hypothetical protein